MTKRIGRLQLNKDTMRQLDGGPGAGFMVSALSACFPPNRPQTGNTETSEA